MGAGYLKVEVYAVENTVPLAGAEISIREWDDSGEYGGNEIYRLATDEDGITETATLYAPDKKDTLKEDYPWLPYEKYDVIVVREGYIPVLLHGVEIFDTELSIQPVQMHPAMQQTSVNKQSGEQTQAGQRAENDTEEWTEEVEYIDIPDNSLLLDTEWDQEGPVPGVQGRSARVLPSVVIPDRITVHLGPKDSNVTNVSVPFIDYIKNVACSEIYPTWPTAALEANIRAIINFALNRIYTEWYPGRGYSFDITNSTSTDQYYKPGQTIFQSISSIADRIFMQYLTRSGFRDPYFTEFCNGSTVTCPGLKQWGTVTLAENGYNSMEILKYYYPNDLVVKEAASIGGTLQSYPGYTLQTGSRGNGVQTIQQQLNRIRINYPLISGIANPNGTYGIDTAQAVRIFQGVFDLPQTGVVDKATWYKISSIYVAVTRLAELDSEGERMDVGTRPPDSIISIGSSGHDVIILQFLLDYISAYYPEIGPVVQDTVFGAGTAEAVRQFQSRFGLAADGIVGPSTWAKLYQVYQSIKHSVPPSNVPPQAHPQYPGIPLRPGSVGSNVAVIQEFLNAIGREYTGIPYIAVDGAFGPATQAAVTAFQKQFGLTPDGVVGPATWSRIVEIYNAIHSVTTPPPYPGTPLRLGTRGASVALLQQHLNRIAEKVQAIPYLTADGVFGPATQQAVILFQRYYGLTPDGIVGPATWNRLMQLD